MKNLDKRWIRVSQILEMIPTHRSDNKWGYPMQQIDSEVLTKKAALGTSVHAAISSHIKEEFYILEGKEQVYLESYFKWSKQCIHSCYMTEARFFYDPMNLTGCIDMIARFKEDGPLHLIDFKTSSVEDPIKWPLQSAFYYFLALNNGLTLDKRSYFVQLDPNGKAPKVHEYEITKELTTTALSLYNIYNFLKKN